MKFTLLSMAAIITALSFTSCKKSDTTTNTPTGKIKAYAEDVTSPSIGHRLDSFNLSYDGSGRLISLLSVTNPIDKILYTYNSKGFNIDITGDDSITLHVVTFLTGSLVDSMYQYSVDGPPNSSKYIYNSASQLIRINDYGYTIDSSISLDDVTAFYYDASGNIIKDADNSYTHTYQYYDTLFLSTGLASLPISPLNGNPNSPKPVNLIKSVITTDNYTGNTITVNYTYTFDAQNRLIGEQAIASDGTIALKRYTYY